MSWWNALISPITDLIGTPIKQWGERKKIKVAAKMEVAKLEAQSRVEEAKAKVEMARKGMQVEADWDARAQEQMKFSLKDEIVMLIIFLPVVLLFISPVCGGYEFQKQIIMSVTALSQFPFWYQTRICGIVAAIFGLRWLIAPLVTRMQNGKGRD